MARVGLAVVFVFSLGVATAVAPPPMTPARDRTIVEPEAAPVPAAVRPLRRVPRTPRPAAAPRRVPPSPPIVVVSAIALQDFPEAYASIPAPPPSAVTAFALPSSRALPWPAIPSSAFPSSRLLFRPPRARPTALVPMYASFAALQALDYHSTRRARARGIGVEANPLLRPVVDNRPAFIAVKAAATAAILIQAERMWKDHPVRAIVFMTAANSAMAIVVAHNYSIK